MSVASAQATDYFRHRERDILGANIHESAEADDSSHSSSDPTVILQGAQKLSTNLVSRATLLPVSAAALLPLVAAGTTQLPIQEMFKIAKRLLLL